MFYKIGQESHCLRDKNMPVDMVQLMIKPSKGIMLYKQYLQRRQMMGRMMGNSWEHVPLSLIA